MYDQFAYWLYDHDLKKTIAFEEKAKALAAQRHKQDTFFLQKCDIALGFYYQKDGKYLKAIPAYRNVVLLDNQTKYAINAYKSLAYCYEKIYNYPKAIKNYELVTSLLDKKTPQSRDNIISHFNIAVISLSIETEEALENGIKHIEIADSLANAAQIQKGLLYAIKHCHAELYNTHLTLDTLKSYMYFEQAYELAKELNDSVGMWQDIFGKGSLFNTTNQDKSIKYLEESFKFIQPGDSLSLYYSTNDLGVTYGYKEEFEKSIDLLQKSLTYLTGDSAGVGTLISSFAETPYKERLLYATRLLAKTYLKYYEKKKDPALLEKSLSYFSLADEMIDYIKVNSDEFTSRLFWRKSSSELYGSAIRACYLKNDPEKAFYYMEKNKALLILEDIVNQQLIGKLGLPEDYFKEEKELLTAIYQLEGQLKSSLLSQEERDQIQKELIDKQLILEALKERHRVPKNITNPIEIETLASLQERISSNEIVIEYNLSLDDGFGIYSNNENGYVLFIGKDNVSFHEISNLSQLQEDLAALIDNIKKPFKTREDVKRYTTLSNHLYERLFPSATLRNDLAGKKLTIIPDHTLSYLPFEALSVSKDELTFLITQNEVSYLYSNSFLQNTQRFDDNDPSFLAVAPSQFQDHTLSQLKYNGKEVESLERYFTGASLLNENSTKDQFVSLLPKRNIIHLATHADAQDEESPWIAFTDDKLTLNELYTLKNNASLVLLSGCNTNLGKQEQGEGVMSLARGFFYGGSQSVISSLWSIDDRSTSEITSSFYDNLSNGQTKSEALHNAKLNYISSHGFSEASPHYWASFVLLGQNDSISTTHTYWPYLILIILIGLIGMYFLKKSKSKGKKN